MTRELAALKKSIGSKIRKRRNDRRMSQEDLAFQAALTTTYLSQIESGKRNPSLAALYRLSCVLQIGLPEMVSTTVCHSSLQHAYVGSQGEHDH